jgi:hypothetical protein
VTDPDLIELAMRVVQESGAKPTAVDHAADKVEPAPIQPPPLPTVPASAGLPPTIPAKERKTAEELAAIILHDLRQIEGCPKRGIKVTVYGINPWNSWLSFGSEAGPVRNKVDVQGFCDVITERLKRLYDVSS